MKKILFIINPISGTVRKKGIVDLIPQFINKQKFEVHIQNTERAGHAIEIAKEAAENHFEYVVAVGGDGTVNEIAKSLLHTNSTLCIIPAGSGNGLARHLKIPLDAKEAIERINEENLAIIDAAHVNGKAFFCTSGTGFDAHIAHQFATAGTRGWKTYVKVAWREFFSYQPQHYQIRTDLGTFEDTLFLITLANAAQFGNNALISPHADIKDGELDLCLLKPFSIWNVPFLVWRLFRGSMHKSNFVQIKRVRKVQILRSAAGAIHLDGEPAWANEKLEYEIIPQALRVLV